MDSISAFIAHKFSKYYPQEVLFNSPYNCNDFHLDIYMGNVLFERYIFYGKCDFVGQDIYESLLLNRIAECKIDIYDLKFCIHVENEKYEFTLPLLSKQSQTITPIKLEKTHTPCFQEDADLFIRTITFDQGQCQIMIDRLYGQSMLNKYPSASQYTEINTLGSNLSSISLKKSNLSHKIQIPVSHRLNYARTSPTSPLANTFKDTSFDFTQRRSSFSKSPRTSGSFVGSFEQSLLANRIPAPFSNPIPFSTSFSVTFTSIKSNLIKSLPTIHSTLDCVFYKLDNGTPYSGELDLSDTLSSEFSDLLDFTNEKSGMKIPGKGQIQIVINIYIAH